MNESDWLRFWAKVEAIGDCLVWTGAQSGGHGQFWDIGLRRLSYAHRYLYEYLIEKLPSGLELHHTCQHKTCVNLDHLQPLTRKEHVLLDGRIDNLWAWHEKVRLSTHCNHGHPRIAENIIWRKGGKHRVCRPCYDKSLRDFYARRASRKSAK